ncbi:protein TALPID3 isoform X2 [Salmo salar]|uniref:Protein TALPID3 isoform X2 n=1 Tax=Salmo salar TaxID=8030 RepID=A0A1S3RCP3_SALSA|nr:protein TALPID3 isoform X2 [Salmo salar]
MAHTLLSRSNELLNFARNINLDESNSSSDAGDVLIRATKIHFPEQSYEGQRDLGSLSTISNKTDNVKITVKKLRDVAQPSLLDEPPKIEKQRQARKQEHRHVPPALQANLPSVSPSEGTKARRKSPIKSVPQIESQVPSIDGKETATSVQTKGSEDKDHDLLISRYAAGGKGALLAALRQRSQTAPLRREVKVQLLDQGPPSSHEPQPVSGLSGDTGAASTAAVVTAAATAPLIKVWEGLQRLLESDRYPGRAQEAREDRASERVTQLEEQLNTVTQQRLQHLEWIQSQQMELQNRLLGSALSVVTGHASVPSTSMLNTGPAATVHPDPRLPQDLPGHVHITHLDAADSSPAVPATASPDPSSQQRGGGGKSPLETPAPRRVIPKPTRWNTTNVRTTQNATQQHSYRTQKTPRTAPQGNGRLLEAIPNNSSSLATRGVQQQSSARAAIATPNDGCQQPAQSREGQHQQEVSNVTSGVRELVIAALAKHSDTNHQHRGGGHQPGLPSSFGVPEQLSSAVKRANDTLQDLGRLKTEMQTLLQSQEEVAVALPPVLPLPPARPTPTLLQRSRPCPSMFEDAERVLRQVQRHKKTLEENVEVILRAKDGETLHSQLEALSCNRDTTEEVRIKKTVDAWINALSKDIQADITKEDLVAQTRAKDKVKESSAAAAVLLQKDRGTKKDTTTFRLNDVKSKIQTGGPRTAGSKPCQRAGRGQTESTEELNNKRKHTTGPNVRLRRSPSQQVSQCGEMKSNQDGEEYLVKLYGKALYEGNRRTLKKGPYLRFNSPSPKSKAPRPRVIESVRGVKMKSSKTQTSLPHGQSVSSSLYPAVPSEPQYIFSPTCGGTQYHPGTSLEGYLIPMAIPLGQPRVDGLAPQPSRVLISDWPVTTSMPPSPPRRAPAPRKPTVAVPEVTSGPRRRQPQLQVQVQPSVNIEPHTPTPTPSQSPAPSPPPPLAAVPPPDIQSVEGTHDEERDDEEQSVFPGTHFLEVADIAQDPEEEEEEEELHDGPIELNGLASPPTAMYHGPVFPCYPAEPLPPPDPVLSSIQHRETLENRLVDWVEQQLMARMISEMYQPPLADPAQNQSPSHSEPEDSVTSDIVEAAGGEGLQLFVDASVPVDSELIRQYVNEALAETIALMLGQREGQERPVAPARPQDPPPQEEPLVPTPVPTPEPSVSPGPPSRGLSPLATPQASEQGTPQQSPREPQPQEPHTSTPADPEPIVTPVTTPDPSPLAVSPLSGPAGPWGDASLPLAEEQPHSPVEEQEKHKPLVMSVAEEEPVSVPPVPPVTSSPQPLSPRSPTPPPPPGPQTPSTPPSSSSSEESTSSSSSSTVTGTDAAARHISEGELLLSYSQAAAARAFEEEGFYVPYLVNSFSSSLQEVQDMDYDPPSEGQVRRPVIPAHHDPILSLLAKMDQGVITQTRLDPEESWEEEGEVSEGQRPRLHPAGERLVTGHRTVTRTGTEPNPRQGHVSSPGQLTLQSADVTDATSFQDTQWPVDIRVLDVEPEMPNQPDTSMSPPPMEDSISHCAPQATELSCPPAPRPAPILVRQFQKTNGETSEKPGERAQQGSRVVAVRLPFTGPEEEEEEGSVSLGLSTRGGGGDTDSSGNDVF